MESEKGKCLPLKWNIQQITFENPSRWNVFPFSIQNVWNVVGEHTLCHAIANHVRQEAAVQREQFPTQTHAYKMHSDKGPTHTVLGYWWILHHALEDMRSLMRRMWPWQICEWWLNLWQLWKLKEIKQICTLTNWLMQVHSSSGSKVWWRWWLSDVLSSEVSLKLF